MRSILLVTEHLRTKDLTPGHMPAPAETTEGGSYIKARNKLWRMHEFVSGGICLDQAGSPAGGFRRAVKP